MIFEINNVYSAKNGSLLDEYPILSKYGYHGEHKAWCGKMIGYVVINSIEKLVELGKDVEHPIIIDAEGSMPTIEIYDGYRE